MKRLLLFSILAFIGAASFSQEIRKKIDTQIKDKKTADNAAKADVFVIDKKKISDTTTVTKSVNKIGVSNNNIKKKRKVKKSS
jgi:hypothetical protein